MNFRHNYRTFLTTTSALAMGCALASPALAADGDDTSGVLKEVVVTSQKRTENLQKVAVSADVLSGDKLQDKHIDNQDALQYSTPSLSIGEAGVTASVNIRGVGLGVSSPAVSMGVAVYRDGLFQPPIFSSEPLFDMASIEVLRGPQGTFVGSNSTGGALVYRSNDPNFSGFSGDMKLGYGNYNDIQLTGAVNLPITDTLAARVAFNEEKRDSFFKETGNGGVGETFRTPGNLNEENLRVSLKWQPLDNLVVLSKTAVTSNLTDGLAHVMSTANPYYLGAPLSYNLTYNVPNTEYNEKAFRQSLQSDYTLKDGIDLRVIAGYNEIHVNYVDDDDSSDSAGTARLPPATAVFNNHVTERVVTEEVNLISPSTSKLTWVAGAFHVEDEAVAGVTVNSPTPPTGVAIRSPSYKEAVAAFGQVSYKVFPNFQIDVGTRYTESFAHNTGSIFLSGLAPFTIALPQAAKESDNAWTGKIGASWTITPEEFAYIFAAKGYKAGGINGPTSPDFAPETVYDYEVGLKSTIGAHIRTQINAFYMDYTNLQLSTYIPPEGSSGLGGGNGVTNAGSSTIWGFEFQAEAKFGAWHFDVNASNVHSTLGKTLYINSNLLPGGGNAPLGPQCATGVSSNPPACFNYAPFTSNLQGGPNPYSPEWTVNLGAEYAFEVGHDATLTPRVDYTFIDDQYQTVLGDPADFIPSHSLVNASLTYRTGPWRIQAYGTNIFNTIYIVGYTYGPSYFLGRPAQYGVNLSRKF